MSAPSWQSHVVSLLVRARMRPHAFKPIDPLWVRANMGRPRSVRRLMLRATGARLEHVSATDANPPGDWISAPSSSAQSPVILYFHGGGFIACSPETHRPLVGSMALRTSAHAFVPAYRLAPEHPFPAALEDAFTSYRYLLKEREFPSHRIVIAGDSAGGGLALSLALALKDNGLPQPAAIVAFCPWTDLASTGRSLDENSDSCSMFAGVTIRRAAAFYLGDMSADDPRVSPLYGDFRGLAPLLIHASEDEVLRDDSVRVAERAELAGVEVAFRLWPRVPHVWQFFPAVMPEARESLGLVSEFVKRHVGSGR